MDAISVRQGVDPKYLQNTLTKDITPLEAIYDLVDNAIDAARERILAAGSIRRDEYGLPADYSAYRIRLRIGSGSISLSDNCMGMDERTLTEHAFVTGFVSSHKYGIGGFGIGLKRALFRLGTRYALSTDTGKFSAVMRFDKNQLSQPNSAMKARRTASLGRTKTLLCINDLELGVSHEFRTRDKADSVVKNLSRRYGLFIRKGLRITVNGKRVPSFGPGIRQSGPVAAQSRSVLAERGVRIFIDSGMHEAYRLTSESDYNSATTGALTDQYGWYLVCNDRIVKVASHEKDLGWTAGWHQEYYGFIGWVRFVAENPEDLPWDTKKTIIDPNSGAFREVSGKLQKFADSYKSANKKARKEGSVSVSSPDSAVTSNLNRNAGDGIGTAQSKTVSVTGHKGRALRQDVGTRKLDANDHNENWGTLLPEMEVGTNHPKLLALMYEASHLSVNVPYAASMLFRAIIEFALFEHLKKQGKYATVCKMHFENQERDGRALSAEQKKMFRPTFSNALEWLKKNHDYFPSDVRRECVNAAIKFGGHLKELNGVVHEGDLTDSGKVKIIRNDTLPLLRFLLRNAVCTM